MSDSNARQTEPVEHWLIERRVRVYPRILLVMFLLAVPTYALTFDSGLDSRGRPMGTDFIAFWSAARVTVEGLSVNPWNILELQEFQRSTFPRLAAPTAWVSPPTTLLMMWPIGHLGYASAFVIWTLAGLAAFLGTLRFVLRGQRYAWALTLAFPGLWLGVAHGQTQFVTAALTAGALLLLGRHPVLAGALIGLMTIKPHLAILFPFVLVASGQWRAFFSAAVTSVGAFGTAALAFGVESTRAWLSGMDLVSSAIDENTLPVHKFVTPYTSLRLLGVPELPALLLHLCVAIVVIGVVLMAWRSTTDLRIRGSFFVLGTFLVTPYAADYDLAVLAFPIAWMSMLGLEHGWRRGDRNLLVIAWLLPWITAPIAVVTHVGITPVVLAFLMYQLRRRPMDDTARSHPQDVAAGT